MTYGPGKLAQIASRFSPASQETTPASITAAILSSVLISKFASLDTETVSEAICWTVLALLPASSVSNAPSRPDLNSAWVGNASSSSFQGALISACVAIYTFCKSEDNVKKYMVRLGTTVFLDNAQLQPYSSKLNLPQPIVTPFLLLAQRRLHPKLGPSNQRGPSHLWGQYGPATVLGSTVLGVCTLAVLPAWNYAQLGIAVGGLTAFVIGWILVLRVVSDTKSSPGPALNRPQQYRGSAELAQLSVRVAIAVAVLLVIDVLRYGMPSWDQKWRILLLGVAKACNWYYIFETTRQGSWGLAGAIPTFSGVIVRNPSVLPTGVLALFHASIAFLNATQVQHLLPDRANFKVLFWGLAFFSSVTWFMFTAVMWNRENAAAGSFLYEQRQHPVQLLASNAKSKFDIRAERRSRNYEAASEAYRRRYSMNPPDGFEGWFNYAAQNESPVIDDFDTLYGNLMPFFRLSGAEVKKLVEQFRETDPHRDLWFCTVEGSSTSNGISCTHPWRHFDRHLSETFTLLLKDVSDPLPRMSFLVNHLDEPRMRIPQEREHPNQWGISQNTHGMDPWAAITKYCPLPDMGEGAYGDGESSTIETYDLPFVRNRTQEMNICSHPEYQQSHGFCQNPTSLDVIEAMIPVLSTGTISAFGDILYPSVAYLEKEFRYQPSDESTSWSEKKNRLYWTGSTTGGFASGKMWRTFHRQRFVELAQNLSPRGYTYLVEAKGIVRRVTSSILDSNFFDVAFTRVFQCEARSCRAQKQHFRVKGWTGKDSMFQSKLVFDLDGNGISGRFYKLLASRSLPLKQTLLQEWHDDRLVPWVHYVPVSQSMDELPELVTYLTTNPVGQKVAKQIADQGREWFSRSMRDVDMGIYLYRLILELARIQDPERPAFDV